MSHQDADHIIQLCESKLTPSLVVGSEGNSNLHEARSSSGTFLVGNEAHDPIVQKYAKKISLWTHIPEENGEAFYIIRYQVGQEYKPHFDWFRSSEEGIKHLEGQGDRAATVLMYLGEPSEGGETEFPNIGLEVPVVKGNAILFWNSNIFGNGDEKTLHGSKPVRVGTKWSMTKWLRERSF
eukprot:TRINITY_DN1904_c0_g2_i16.p1 TRINITY_DN1904_c0_g2~~TRINITY_DN1904_c0_g2_i16.p1  ORF type:complete len:181 (-),score=33.03 TRINITY_DN1904_c0_g2_i16:201-743(-)